MFRNLAIRKQARGFILLNEGLHVHKRPAEWQFQITILEQRSGLTAAADDRDCDGTIVSQRRDRAIGILKAGARKSCARPKRARIGGAKSR
jgi:hypothetical protein